MAKNKDKKNKNKSDKLSDFQRRIDACLPTSVKAPLYAAAAYTGVKTVEAGVSFVSNVRKGSDKLIGALAGSVKFT